MAPSQNRMRATLPVEGEYSPIPDMCKPTTNLNMIVCIIPWYYLLYSWHFSRYSVPIHWLVHGHMTSSNETVSRQMPRGGNIAKTMTSNGKQFTVTHKMLTAVANDQRWPDVVTEISKRISMFSLTSSWETLRF